MRNVQDLVNSMNDNNKYNEIRYELCGNTIFGFTDYGESFALISFEDKKELFSSYFEKLDLNMRKMIFDFLAHSKRDDWFKKFGIAAFEYLCEELSNSCEKAYTCQYCSSHVNLRGNNYEYATFNTDGYFCLYTITDKKFLEIINDFIQSTDWKEILEKNKDVLEAGE